MSAQVSREIRLKARPTGLPTKDDFELASVELKAPAEGEVQVRNLWMSVDPYMRARMIDRPSYVPPFQLGQPLQGAAVGEVVASRYPAFKSGDIVRSMFGWRESFNAPAKAIEKIELRGLPMQTFLGAAGGPGLAAYVGLLKIAELKDGDVVFVSAASGAVGSIVCQIAKIKGHTVIASTGGTDKCAYLEELGVDHIIDYKTTKDIAAALRNAAPHGIDVYFDNVGGEHLDAALARMNSLGRVAVCGMISGYNSAGSRTTVHNLANIIYGRINLRGFVAPDFMHMYDQFKADMAGWLKDGRIKYQETVFEGIANAPAAMVGLMHGENTGKMLVKLAD